MYGEDFSLLSSAVSRKGTFFHFKTTRKCYNDMFVPLLGAFQCENIALAVQTCEVILNKTIESPARATMAKYASKSRQM